MGRMAKHKGLLAGVLAGGLGLATALAGTAAWAQQDSTGSATATGQSQSAQSGSDAMADGVHIELNKLEQQGDACRAYLLFENDRGDEYSVYRLDLVLFDKQGRIDRRIAVDASPLRAGKSVVKLFDLSGLQCDGISKILLNDIAPCEDGSGAREDCVVGARLSTLTDVSFYK